MRRKRSHSHSHSRRKGGLARWWARPPAEKGKREVGGGSPLTSKVGESIKGGKEEKVESGS